MEPTACEMLLTVRGGRDDVVASCLAAVGLDPHAADRAAAQLVDDAPLPGVVVTAVADEAAQRRVSSHQAAFSFTHHVPAAAQERESRWGCRRDAHHVELVELHLAGATSWATWSFHCDGEPLGWLAAVSAAHPAALLTLACHVPGRSARVYEAHAGTVTVTCDVDVEDQAAYAAFLTEHLGA